MPNVNHEILEWARDTAGLSRAEAVARLKLGDARGVQAIDRLKDLEEGRVSPTRPMLVKMAKVYRRPLLVFYLSKPPRRGDRGQDFRTLPSAPSPATEGLLDALIRSVLARQALIRSAMVDEGEDEPVAFIGSVSMGAGVESLVGSIRQILGFSVAEFRSARNAREGFQFLRARTETAGVFVLLAGNLGNHHSNIGLETFRGFALADEVAPFVVINDQDHPAAWSFTLIHELAHLWLGQTGVSGGKPGTIIERFCNDVASEFLLPSEELDEIRLSISPDMAELVSVIDDFSKSRNVSRSMVAYKLFRRGFIERDAWLELSEFFRSHWLQNRERNRVKAKTSAGGPDYYVVRRHRLGRALVRLTARMMSTGALTTSRAGQVLGVNPKNVQHLVGGFPFGTA